MIKNYESSSVVYVVMETIDLGGSPVSVYTYKQDAEKNVSERNLYYREQKIKELMICDYSKEEAELWVDSGPVQFYLECVEFL